MEDNLVILKNLNDGETVDFNEARKLMENKEEVLIEWRSIERLGITKGNYKDVFCERCVGYDFRNNNLRDRTNYCNLVLVDKEKNLDHIVTPFGTRRSILIGEILLFSCKICNGSKSIFVDFDEETIKNRNQMGVEKNDK